MHRIIHIRCVFIGISVKSGFSLVYGYMFTVLMCVHILDRSQRMLWDFQCKYKSLFGIRIMLRCCCFTRFFHIYAFSLMCVLVPSFFNSEKYDSRIVISRLVTIHSKYNSLILIRIFFCFFFQSSNAFCLQSRWFKI